MESRAPAVVAVVVTTGPGPGLEATLASLAAQDYAELSLLVVANGDSEHVAARVASVARDAFVRVLEENRGFGAACNEAALMVEGSSFFLFCHDDVRLDADAVHVMVESAFRTNAGIVTPKVVAYDDPLVLLHVGQTCDRFGVVQERVELGEIDHGQQDLERDVFVAPGGVTLVRTDLFTTIRGFDPLIPVLGEDLDLCWRAQVAGARIIVAPAAKVAHRETIARGERPVTAIGTRRASRSDLQRRHQLLVVATGWGKRYTFTTLVLLLGMEIMEFFLALLGRDTDRAGAIVGSWRWVFFNRQRIFERRRQRHAFLVLSDPELRRLQIGGAHRLQRFFVTLLREGFDAARGILPAADVGAEANEETDDVTAAMGFGVAFAESEEFDDLPESATLELRRRPTHVLTSFRSQALVILGVALLWLFGSRNLVAMHLPLIGRLAPLDSWWSTWRHFFASWSPNGVGTGSPGMPGYGLLGFAGTFVFGRMGILPRIALIVAAPMGAVGVARLLKGRVSNRARVVASVAYLALPVGLNLINQGRIDVLVVVALFPLIARRLFDLLAVPGFPAMAFRDPVPFARRGWRLTRSGQRVVTALLVAVSTAMAPATLVAALLVVVGVIIARGFDAEERLRTRPGRVFGSLLLTVAALLAPLTVDTALAGRRAFEVFGLARGPWSSPSFSLLLRGADGSFGASWWGYLLPGAALLGFAVSRGERRRLATMLLSIATLTLIVANLDARHWMGSFSPDLDVLLVVYVFALAAMIGLGVGALELDLRQAGFGWRQLAAGLTVAALVVATAPFLWSLGSGRFNLPTTSVAQSLSTLSPSSLGGYRVLWLADPSVSPIAGWSIAPGLEASTSMNGLPGGDTLFTTPDSGASDVILKAVALSLEGRTVRLGELLAPAGISAIVVLNSVAPELAGVLMAPMRPVPTNLMTALSRQTDLSLELQTGSVEVFANSLFHGVASQSSGTSASGWVPALGANATSGPVNSGATVVLGLAPASAFSLVVNGAAAPRTVAGWLGTYQVGSFHGPVNGRVVLHRLPLNGVLAGATLALWAVMLLGLAGVQRLEALYRRTNRPVVTARHARGPS